MVQPHAGKAYPKAYQTGHSPAYLLTKRKPKASAIKFSKAQHHGPKSQSPLRAYEPGDPD